MKRLKLTLQDKKDLAEELDQLVKQYEESPLAENLCLKKNFTKRLDDKITILFTQQAYIRALSLVRHFHGEVGWQGCINRVDDKTYRVYDILVYPQLANGARVLDPTKDNNWVESLPKEKATRLYHGHSHVNMGTNPSDIDIRHQKTKLSNLCGAPFYLFQIWNKQGDINSYLYDMEKKLLYDRNDITIEITDSEFGTISGFLDDACSRAGDLSPRNEENMLRRLIHQSIDDEDEREYGYGSV